MQRLSVSVFMLHVMLSIVVMATTTPVAAQSAAPVESSCRCGPGAMPAYAPPYPQPALRPVDGNSRQGISYRDGRGYRAARTNLGTSAYEAETAPAVWSGFYAGLHGGAVSGRTGLDDPRFSRVHERGTFGGAHIGRNWQLGRLVFGVEADGQRSFASGTERFASGFTFSTNRDWSASARLRGGVTFGSFLLYGTAGAAVAGHTITARDTLSSWRGPETHVGAVYGGGLEWQATRNLTLRGEILRYDFNERSMLVGGAQAPVKLDDTVVRGGITWRFN